MVQPFFIYKIETSVLNYRSLIFSDMDSPDSIREFIIEHFCEDPADIKRILDPIEKSPKKYADGTEKTKPILRQYAMALLEKHRQDLSLEEKLASQQEQIASLEEKIASQQEQISSQQEQLDKLNKKLKKVIELFVDTESETESEPARDEESEEESEQARDEESEEESEPASEPARDEESETESEPASEEESEPVEPIPVVAKGEPETELEKQPNSRKCGRCGLNGHYKNNCPEYAGLPKCKTSTWNALNKSKAISKYTCEYCGKQELNKSNLDRHKANNH